MERTLTVMIAAQTAPDKIANDKNRSPDAGKRRWTPTVLILSSANSLVFFCLPSNFVNSSGQVEEEQLRLILPGDAERCFIDNGGTVPFLQQV